MRALFIIIGIIGLLLTGLSIFELHLTTKHRAEIRSVQRSLESWQKSLIAEEAKLNIHYTGDSAGYDLEDGIKTCDGLERASLISIFTSFGLLILSVIGLRKVKSETC